MLSLYTYMYALSCSPIKGGIDAKELFHVYITRWIQEKRLSLLEFCKFDKVCVTIISTPTCCCLENDICLKIYVKIWQVKFSSLPTQHSTTSFVDDIYERLKGALAEYDVIISRWPEYTFTLENVCTILLI